MRREAKITSKGRITVPQEVLRLLGVRPGDKLLFEIGDEGVRVRSVRTQSPFAKYRGIGNLGILSGRKGINRWIKQMRGE